MTVDQWNYYEDKLFLLNMDTLGNIATFPLQFE